MRPLGHMGTGEGSPRIRTPEVLGVPTQISACAPGSVTGDLVSSVPGTKHKLLALRGGQPYTPRPQIQGRKGSSSILTTPTPTAPQTTTPRPHSTFSSLT